MNSLNKKYSDHMIVKVYVPLIANLKGPHLAHLALTVSSEKGHIVNFIHHHKVLLLSLEILQREWEDQWGTQNCRSLCSNVYIQYILWLQLKYLSWLLILWVVTSQTFVSYMRFGPEDEDLSHHAEQLLSIWVPARQPSCSKTHATFKMSRELKIYPLKKPIQEP